MNFILVLLIVLALFILGIVLKRRWRADETAPAEADEFAQMAAHLRTRAESLFQGLNDKQPAPDARQFRAWAALTFADARQIRAWLDALSDDQIGALTGHLDGFCRDMGFELVWLLDDRLADMPQMGARLSQVAELYIRAAFQAVAVQGEVDIFRVRQRLLAEPQNRADRKLREQLFGKLVEQDLSDVSISAHMAASAQDRQRQISAAIQHAASAHPHALDAAIKAVLMERAAAAATAPQATTNGDRAAAAVAANGADAAVGAH
ncbi:MAG: hypothetical protein R2854_11135 [Caldilineaceae bacterium]